MTRMPSKWQQELAAQARLRKLIAQQEKAFGQAKLDELKALRDGGIGWPSRAGGAMLRADRAWNRIRVLLLKLYNRKVVA